MSDVSATNQMVQVEANPKHYNRRRMHWIVWRVLNEFFDRQTKSDGLTVEIMAERLEKSVRSVKARMSYPGNMTIETLSDLVWAMGGEFAEGLAIRRFQDRPKGKILHPLLASLLEEEQNMIDGPDEPD